MCVQIVKALARLHVLQDSCTGLPDKFSIHLYDEVPFLNGPAQIYMPLYENTTLTLAKRFCNDVDIFTLLLPLT